MAEESKENKSDIVSSIFERPDKKRPSSLFTGKGAPQAPDGVLKEENKEAPVIKKRLPIGLDIGTSSVKILQLGFDHRGAVKIINLAIEEIPAGVRENPKERNSAVRDILKRTVDGLGLKGESCFAALSAASGNINFVTLPEMPENEISQALKWTMKEIVPAADVSELALDYVTLLNQKARFLGDQLGILAVWAPKKEIFEYMSLLESVSLVPLAIDVAPLSDVASLEYSKKLNPYETVVLADFGAGKTSMNVISGGELIFTRMLNVTGNSLTAAVAGYCNVTSSEAEELKKNFGILESEKASGVRNAILPLLENMVQDMEQAFKYFSYRVTRSHVTRFDRVILSGGSSFIQALIPFLSNRIGVPVETVDSLSGLSALDAKLQDKLGILSPRMNVALGLALRGMG